MGQSQSFAKPPARNENRCAKQSAPSSVEIRLELDRIVVSAPLRDSLRLASFLRFVVEAALNGRTSQIKAYTVATEALGRPASFNSDVDSIVRVQAGRLRHALARYYASAGLDDTIVIELPRGSYVPLFCRRECGPSFGTPPRRKPRTSADSVIAAAIDALQCYQTTLEEVSERVMQLHRQIEEAGGNDKD
jgi:hypothetical protein